MIRRWILLCAVSVLSPLASAARCERTTTEFLCTLKCYNQFIVCKSWSYEAKPCQDAYNACVAGCVTCLPSYSPGLGLREGAVEPDIAEKIFGARQRLAE